MTPKQSLGRPKGLISYYSVAAENLKEIHTEGFEKVQREHIALAFSPGDFSIFCL